MRRTKGKSSPWGGASKVALVIKNLPAKAGDVREASVIPGSGRSSGGGRGNPLQYSCLENTMDRGAWQAAVRGVARVIHSLATKPPPLNIKNKI